MPFQKISNPAAFKDHCELQLTARWAARKPDSSSWAQQKAITKQKFTEGWAVKLPQRWAIIYSGSFGNQRGLERYRRGPYLGDWGLSAERLPKSTRLKREAFRLLQEARKQLGFRFHISTGSNHTAAEAAGLQVDHCMNSQHQPTGYRWDDLWQLVGLPQHLRDEWAVFIMQLQEQGGGGEAEA